MTNKPKLIQTEYLWEIVIDNVLNSKIPIYFLTDEFKTEISKEELRNLLLNKTSSISFFPKDNENKFGHIALYENYRDKERKHLFRCYWTYPIYDQDFYVYLIQKTDNPTEVVHFENLNNKKLIEEVLNKLFKW